MAGNDSVTDHSAPQPDLGRKLRQLVAATNAISGGGFESFSEMSAELKDDYLCMVADLAAEALSIDRRSGRHLGGRLTREASHG